MIAGSIRRACVPRDFHRSALCAISASGACVVAQCLKSSSTCLGACEARARCAVWWVRGTSLASIHAACACIFSPVRQTTCMTLSGPSRSASKAIPLAHAFQKIAKNNCPTGLRYRTSHAPTESSSRQPCILGTLATPWSWIWTPAVSRTGGQS